MKQVFGHKRVAQDTPDEEWVIHVAHLRMTAPHLTKAPRLALDNGCNGTPKQTSGTRLPLPRSYWALRYD
jgi:hypothetical protein